MISLVGVFFTPETGSAGGAGFRFTGQGSQDQTKAQFITFRLTVDGQGVLKMKPDPESAVLFVPSDTPPDTTITAGPAGILNSSDATLEFTSNEQGSTFECRLDDDPFDTCFSPHSISDLAEGNHTFSVRAIDAVGQPDPSPASLTWQVDTVPPTIIYSRTPAPNANGWNNTDVTVTFSCSDATSGVQTCPGPTTLSGEGADQSVVATATDYVGNSASVTVGGINIDRTSPNTTATAPFGWNNTSVTITLNAFDALSGVQATYFTLNGGTQQEGTSLTISEDGVHALEFWSVDQADNVEPAKTVQVKIDQTSPSITHAQSPDANAYGWNRTDVTVTFACEDVEGSGIASCTPPQTVTTEGKYQQVTGTALDNAGNTATDPATVSIDKTAPAITGAPDRPTNVNGWYRADVVVAFTCNDALSGIAGCSAAITLGEGANQTATGEVTDAADNASSTRLSAINVDKTSPTIVLTARTPASNAAGWNSTDVTLAWSCSDALSGPVSPTITEAISAEGVTVLTATCSDLAGNTATDTQSVRIDKTNPGISFIGLSPLPNSAGWNNTDVILTWSCTDAVSGPESATVSRTLTAEGANQSGTGTCFDVAGNTASDTHFGVNIDKTGPLTQIVGPTITVSTITGSAGDNLSGVESVSVTYVHQITGAATTVSASCACGQRSVLWTASAPLIPGPYTTVARSKDQADNLGPVSQPVTIFVI